MGSARTSYRLRFGTCCAVVYEWRASVEQDTAGSTKFGEQLGIHVRIDPELDASEPTKADGGRRDGVTSGERSRLLRHIR